MIQLNEETSNRRPITLWLKEKASQPTKPSEVQDVAAALANTSDSDNEGMYRTPEWQAAMIQSRAAALRGKSTKKTPRLETKPESEKEMPYVRKRVDMFRGLVGTQIITLIK